MSNIFGTNTTSDLMSVAETAQKIMQGNSLTEDWLEGEMYKVQHKWPKTNPKIKQQWLKKITARAEKEGMDMSAGGEFEERLRDFGLTIHAGDKVWTEASKIKSKWKKMSTAERTRWIDKLDDLARKHNTSEEDVRAIRDEFGLHMSEEVEVSEGIRDFKVGDTVKFVNDDSDFLGQTGKITSLSGNGISQKATVKLDKGGKSITNVLVKVDLIKEEVKIEEKKATQDRLGAYLVGTKVTVDGKRGEIDYVQHFSDHPKWPHTYKIIDLSVSGKNKPRKHLSGGNFISHNQIKEEVEIDESFIDDIVDTFKSILRIPKNVALITKSILNGNVKDMESLSSNLSDKQRDKMIKMFSDQLKDGKYKKQGKINIIKLLATLKHDSLKQNEEVDIGTKTKGYENMISRVLGKKSREVKEAVTSGGVEYGEQDWDTQHRIENSYPNLDVNFAEFHEQGLEGPYLWHGETYFFDRKIGSWYSVTAEDFVDDEASKDLSLAYVKDGLYKRQFAS